MINGIDNLKAEQAVRISLRETALYVNATFLVGAIGVSKIDELIYLPVALPLWSLIIISIYLSNDYYVSKIRQFIIESKHEDRWESWHRKGTAYKIQKYIRNFCVFISFPLPSFISTIYTISCLSIPYHKMVSSLSVAVTLMVLILYVLIFDDFILSNEKNSTSSDSIEE